MKPKYLELSAEELEKVARTRSRNEGIKIDHEQLFIAEFGKHYGWDGVMAILRNEIDGETVLWLMQAARKVDSRYAFSNAQSVLIGSGSSRAKSPSQVFKKATRELIKQSKADI